MPGIVAFDAVERQFQRLSHLFFQGVAKSFARVGQHGLPAAFVNHADGVFRGDKPLIRVAHAIVAVQAQGLFRRGHDAFVRQVV